MDSSALKRLLLAQMKVHCFSDKQVAPAHPGRPWRSVLGVGAGSDGLLARVRHNQKRVGIIECRQDQSITLSLPIGSRGGTWHVMLGGGQDFRPGSYMRGREGGS